MSLAEKLAEISQQSAKRIPADIAAIMEGATNDLRSSGILDGMIKIGQQMPDFTLLNQSGIPTSSALLRKDGPLVLTVFRGSW